MRDLHQLRPGELRFTIKNVPQPRRKENWRVYDTVTGSFPYDRPDIGQVQQDRPQAAEAQAEADRLNETGGTP